MTLAGQQANKQIDAWIFKLTSQYDTRLQTRQLRLLNIQEMCVYHIICNIPNRISSVTLTKPYVGLEWVVSIVHTNISNISVRQSDRRTNNNGRIHSWLTTNTMTPYYIFSHVCNKSGTCFCAKNNIIFLKEIGFVFSTYHLTHTPSSALFNRKLRGFRFCALPQYLFVTFHWYLTRLFLLWKSNAFHYYYYY